MAKLYEPDTIGPLQQQEDQDLVELMQAEEQVEKNVPTETDN